MSKRSIAFALRLILACCGSTVAWADSVSSGDFLRISLSGDGGEATASPFQSLPLHAAALHDNVPWAVQLINRGADVNARDADGRTPLMVAAAFDSIEVARLLLERGADVEAADTIGGYAPVHFAAGYGHVAMLDVLQSAGADIFRGANNGQTPLHFAALSGRLRMIGALVAKGADPNVADANGIRAIQYATIRLQTAAADLLRSLGARSDDLFDAVNAGDVARVQELLADGADVNAIDIFGTALHRAVASGRVYVANMLIDAGAALEAEGDPAQSHPLHLAALKNDAAMARLLIERGADIESRDSWGRTPLIVAASNGAIKVAEVLLEIGADPVVEDAVYHDTAIHNAVFAGDTEMVALLLAQGVDVNLRSAHAGETLLRYAAQKGDPNMVGFLIRLGANPAIRDRQGRSPLDVALGFAKARLVVPVLRQSLEQ